MNARKILNFVCCLTFAISLLAHARTFGQQNDAGDVPIDHAVFGTDESFDNLILPIMTKAGCNTGACHGASSGRGGFRLSLFGQNATRDWESITRELGGRRVNVVHPEKSLLLRKAGEFVEHGGGQRLEPDSESWDDIALWIRRGAVRFPTESPQPPRMVRLKLEPVRIRTSLSKLHEESIRVVAEFSDGSLRDMTRHASLSPLDPGSVSTNSDRATVHPRRIGRHVVLIRVRDVVSAMEILVSDDRVIPSDRLFENGNYIDHHIARSLSDLGIAAGDSINEISFLRRVTLDLCGRIPTVDEITAYCLAKPDVRRRETINRLVSSTDTIDHWSELMVQMLSGAQHGNSEGDSVLSTAYRRFVREQMVGQVPLPETLVQLVSAEGSLSDNAAVGFYLSANDGRSQAELFSEVFMGVRMRCANCHDHPLDHWTQDDYHGLAALFTGIRRSPLVGWQPGATHVHPATGEPAQGFTPDRRMVDLKQDPRPFLSQYVREDPDQLIAKAWVNRIWATMMGRPLIDPVDDLRDSNPPSHPELLDALVADWRANRFEWMHLVRTIAESQAYSRASVTEYKAIDSSTQAVAVSMYACREPKLLSRKVLSRALEQVTTGSDQEARSEDASADNQVAAEPGTPNDIRLIGKDACPRAAFCSVANEDSLAARLETIVGTYLNDSLELPDGQVQRWAHESDLGTDLLISEVYRKTLGRQPRVDEMVFWSKQFGSVSHRREVLEDMVWSLLTCREFITNH